jgi:hypothetical protein
MGMAVMTNANEMPRIVHGLRGYPLGPADYESLSTRWIDRATADLECIRRIDHLEGREIVGRTGAGLFDGLLIPYVLPGETSVREFRLRRDHPDYENGKPQQKYMSPPGRGNMLYFPIRTQPSWLLDQSLPIVIVEGEFKAIALSRLAAYELGAAELPHFLVVAISGVWNWRGRIGKIIDSSGARVDEKGPIPDLERLSWSKRQVIIVFDADVETNDTVRAARFALTRELIRRGAVVRWFGWPPEIPEKVKGVDDLLAAWEPDKVRELLHSSKAPNSSRINTQNQTQVLAALGKDTQLFHTPDGEAYARVAVAEHHETWPVRSKGLRRWLIQTFYKTTGKPPGAQALQDALGLLEARAHFDGPECPVFVRIAECQDRIFIDLCNTKWEAVEITSHGWRVVENPSVRFRRTKGMLSLPGPARDGSITLLRRYINIGSDSNWVLCVSWLLAACRFRGPFPILILQGEQGSAKSTTEKMLRRIIDPSAALVRTPPRDDRDLLIAASNTWVLAYDNLSGVQPWLADALCRLATGGGFSTRELYSDSEEILFDAMRPVILNGIDQLADRPDLADRSLILNLPRIDDSARRDERQLYADFERDLPSILGGLFSVASATMAQFPTVTLDRKPRMADFAVWATAAEKPLGFAEGTFMQAYGGNRADAVQEALESDPVGATLVALLDALKEQGRREPWMGTCKELLAMLDPLVGEGVKKSATWPKTPRGLSGKLRRLVTFLRDAGIEVVFIPKTGKGQRLLSISRTASDLTATIDTTAPSD